MNGDYTLWLKQGEREGRILTHKEGEYTENDGRMEDGRVREKKKLEKNGLLRGIFMSVRRP